MENLYFRTSGERRHKNAWLVPWTNFPEILITGYKIKI
jgi:hypothetical protein